MVELTCFSFSLNPLLGVVSLLREETGAKTFDFSDSFSSVSDKEPVKFDVCVTALLLIPLLLLPNIIDQAPELDLQMTDESAQTEKPFYRPAPAQVTHYIVTPLPPTPPTFWRPNRNITNLPQQSLTPSHNDHPRPIVTQFESNAFSQEEPKLNPATTRTTTSTTRTTSLPLTPLKKTSQQNQPPDSISKPLDNEDAETFKSDLWADVPVEPQPDITKVSNVIERQIQSVRERYQDMGVPRRFLTRDMIWKLIRGETKHSGFHFQ